MSLQIERNFSYEPRKHPRVLLVEDDIQWQLILSKTISKIDKSAKVTCVNSVTAARRSLDQDGDYDLIMSDFLFQDHLTGVDLWWSKQRLESRAEFILISGKSGPQIRELSASGNELPQLLSKNTSVNQLFGFLQEKLEQVQLKHRMQKPKAKKFVFGTLLFAGLLAVPTVDLIRTAPLDLDLSTESGLETGTSSFAPNLMEKKATRPKPVRIDQIVSPELLKQVQEISQRNSDFDLKVAANDEAESLD